MFIKSKLFFLIYFLPTHWATAINLKPFIKALSVKNMLTLQIIYYIP
jgi:hypothetical protein